MIFIAIMRRKFDAPERVQRFSRHPAIFFFFTFTSSSHIRTLLARTLITNRDEHAFATNSIPYEKFRSSFLITHVREKLLRRCICYRIRRHGSDVQNRGRVFAFNRIQCFSITLKERADQSQNKRKKMHEKNTYIDIDIWYDTLSTLRTELSV